MYIPVGEAECPGKERAAAGIRKFVLYPNFEVSCLALDMLLLTSLGLSCPLCNEDNNTFCAMEDEGER